MQTRRLVLALAAATVAFGAPAFAQQKAAKPLKITVYGGSGNIGSRIVKEAVARGHSVTVVDRAPKAELAPAGVKLIQGDAMDAKDIARNIAGQDVVVSSVILRSAPSPDFALKVAQAMVEAQRTQKGAAKTRLLVVGGASSLYNASGKRIVDTLPATLPQGTLWEIRSAVAALDWLRAEVKDTAWTFFSPASNIAPGTRTGKFRLGTEQLVVDAAGNSAISMEDFAVAMLDEIEKPQFMNKRFTAAY